MEISTLKHRQPNLVSRSKYILRLLLNDKFYDAVNIIFTDVYQLDSLLSTVCYFSLFLSELIRLRPKIIKSIKNTLIKFAKILVKYLLKYNITKNFVKHLHAKIHDSEIAIEKQENVENIKVPEVSTKLRSLSDYISDVRIFNRMWGLPGMMSFGISGVKGVLANKSSSNIMRLLEIIDIVSIVVYQPLENIGFAADHKWSSHPEEKRGLVSLWYYVISSRLWAAFVVIEIIKLSVQYVKEFGTANVSLLRNTPFTRDLISNLANLPLTAHWSLYEGCLPDLAVGFFGTFSSCMNTMEYINQIIQKIQQL